MKPQRWKRDKEPRVELGPAILDLGDLGIEPVDVLEHRSQRRVIVQWPSGSMLLVPERLLR